MSTAVRAGRRVWVGALLAGAALAFVACEDPHLRTTPEQAGVSTAGACVAAPGQFPVANCDNSDKKCRGGGCAIDVTRCGSDQTCLPIGDNTGKSVLDLRVRRLNIAAPPALAGNFIQNTVVNLNLDLAERACAESGKGLFSWILRLDRAANTLVTGGAPPATDPFGKGFCFASLAIGNTRVEPIRTNVAFEGDTFRSVEPRDINIPIFLSPDPQSAVILPISGVVLRDVTVSEKGNCIGSFNPAALDPSCTDDRSLCAKWNTAGALGGFITLEAADRVTIRDLGNKSLCSFLSSTSDLKCARDAAGKIVYQGDYCSTDKQPGSCADSVWLAATFAASAAKIFDDPSSPGCLGASPADAGSDAGDAGP